MWAESGKGVNEQWWDLEYFMLLTPFDVVYKREEGYQDENEP